jgi:hypothetical protein
MVSRSSRIVELVQAERMRADGRTIEVARVRITEAGRRALAAGGNNKKSASSSRG